MIYFAGKPVSLFVVLLVLAFVIVTGIVLVMSMRQASRTPKRTRRRMGSYPALRIISALLRLVGWCSLILAVFIFFVGISAGPQLNHYFNNTPYGGGAGALVTSLVVSIALSFFMAGLWNLAIGEALKVFVDIALNTEVLKDVAADTNYFYERLAQPSNQTEQTQAGPV